MTKEEILKAITQVVHEHIGTRDMGVYTHTTHEISPEKLAAFLAEHLQTPKDPTV